MADKKISALTGATTPLAGTEVLPIVQNGSTVNVSVANLTASGSYPGVFSSLVVPSYASSSFSTGNKTAYLANYYNSGTGDDCIGIYGNYDPRSNTAGASWGTVGITLRYHSGTAGAIDLAIGAVGVAPTTAATVMASGLSFPVGNGINFTANTPAAGMTSQLLNWYEEGTWTPVVTAGAGSLTSYTSSGSYTRIGRMVHVQAIVTLTNAGTGSGALFISLPINSGAYGIAVGVVRENGLTGNLAQVYVNASSSTATVFTSTNTSIIATGAVIAMTLDYQV